MRECVCVCVRVCVCVGVCVVSKQKKKGGEERSDTERVVVVVGKCFGVALILCSLRPPTHRHLFSSGAPRPAGTHAHTLALRGAHPRLEDPVLALLARPVGGSAYAPAPARLLKER